MDYKLEYITRFFEKTSKKRIENYVLTRIWHKIDDLEIKIVPQQYIYRTEEKYALTDIYFPQFDICVEVNEPAHYESDEKINLDKKRKEEIEATSNFKVYEIDCRPELPEINKQIDNLIDFINHLKKKQKAEKSFEPWQPENEFSVTYWQENGVIDSRKNISFFTIDKVCDLFGVNPQKIKRGFLRLGGISHPQNKNYLIWWPSVNKRSNWINSYNPETQEIIESNDNEQKNEDHLKWGLKTNEKRITFLYKKDFLGFKTYKFVGIYEVDKMKSETFHKLVWKKIAENFNLKTLKIE